MITSFRVHFSEDDSSRAEQKRLLTGACSTGDGRACYYLSRMHEEDGDAYTATELRARACSLGYQAACSL